MRCQYLKLADSSYNYKQIKMVIFILFMEILLEKKNKCSCKIENLFAWKMIDHKEIQN